MARSTAKPSAPIYFASDYDGQSIAGEAETFHITLTIAKHISIAELTIHINSDSSLLDKAETHHYTLTADNPDVIQTITITPPLDGKYYLNILAQVEVDNQTQAKAFTQVIQTGAPTKNSPKRPVHKSRDGQKVIILPAQETLSQ